MNLVQREEDKTLPFFYKTSKATGQPQEPRLHESRQGERTYDGLVLHHVPRCDIIRNGLWEREVISEAEIFATSERLWQVILTNQGIYSKQISNQRRYPNLQNAWISFHEKRGKLSKASLTHLAPNSNIGWKRKEFLLPGFLRRETLFQIIPHVDGMGVTLLHREIFSGILVPFLNSRILRTRSEIQLSSTEIREKAEDIS